MKKAIWLGAAFLVLVLAQVLTWQSSEPFYNNDETRHVMTGVFFRDLLIDQPLNRPRDYAVEYYLQYPALGLMVWPPLFYGIEGIFMLFLGTSYLTAKAVLWLFSAWACTSLFLLVRRTHDPFTAMVTVIIFGLAPLVQELTRHVMLEMPALAFALAAIYHFHRYLDEKRPLDIYIAAIAAAGFALTRFDGHFLLAFFLLCLLGLRRLDVLRRREVWLAAVLAILLILPVYVPFLTEFGEAHVLMTLRGGENGFEGRTIWYHVFFYPLALARQFGWVALVPALLGFAVSLPRPERRRACWPYFGLVAATYLSFSPLAEVEERHAIYWYPAFALFAVEGIRWLADRLPLPATRTRPALAGLVVAGCLVTAILKPTHYVRGYDEAARYVLANTGESRFCMMDGFLNGDFIYQLRRQDPERRLWTLRADKVLYGVLISPRGGYREYAGGDQAILDTLYRYDPELIVVEEPQVGFQIPMAERLRKVLAGHPDRFEKVKSFPVESNVPLFRNVRLDVYRAKIRNPTPATHLSFDMIGLGRSLGTALPPAKSK